MCYQVDKYFLLYLQKWKFHDNFVVHLHSHQIRQLNLHSQRSPSIYIALCFCFLYRGLLPARLSFLCLFLVLVSQILPSQTSRSSGGHIDICLTAWTVLHVLLMRPHNIVLVAFMTVQQSVLSGSKLVLSPSAAVVFYVWMGRAAFFSQVITTWPGHKTFCLLWTVRCLARNSTHLWKIKNKIDKQEIVVICCYISHAIETLCYELSNSINPADF